MKEYAALHLHVAGDVVTDVPVFAWRLYHPEAGGGTVVKDACDHCVVAREVTRRYAEWAALGDALLWMEAAGVTCKKLTLVGANAAMLMQVRKMWPVAEPLADLAAYAYGALAALGCKIEVSHHRGAAIDLQGLFKTAPEEE